MTLNVLIESLCLETWVQTEHTNSDLSELWDDNDVLKSCFFPKFPPPLFSSEKSEGNFFILCTLYTCIYDHDEKKTSEKCRPPLEGGREQNIFILLTIFRIWSGGFFFLFSHSLWTAQNLRLACFLFRHHRFFPKKIHVSTLCITTHRRSKSDKVKQILLPFFSNLFSLLWNKNYTLFFPWKLIARTVFSPLLLLCLLLMLYHPILIWFCMKLLLL